MRTLRYLQALNEALHMEMERDPRVFVVGEDVRCALRGATRGLLDRFGPKRVVDTPISEAAFTGMATGAAMAGMRPVVEYQIPALLYVSFDQIVNQAQKLPYMTGGQGTIPVTYLVIASGARSGLAGQHSDNPYPYLMHAGVKVVIPATPYDVKGLMLSAIREDDPVAFFAPAACLPLRGEVPEGDYTVPIGKGEIKRSGTDVTVVAVGHLVHEALKAAEELSAEAIEAEIFDPRSLLPFDSALLGESVAKTGRAVIFDDSNHTCGFAAEAAALVAEEWFGYLKAPVRRVTRMNVPVPFSAPLEQYVLPNRERLKATIRQMLKAKGGVA